MSQPTKAAANRRCGVCTHRQTWAAGHVASWALRAVADSLLHGGTNRYEREDVNRWLVSTRLQANLQQVQQGSNPVQSYNNAAPKLRTHRARRRGGKAVSAGRAIFTLVPSKPVHAIIVCAITALPTLHSGVHTVCNHAPSAWGPIQLELGVRLDGCAAVACPVTVCYEQGCTVHSVHTYVFRCAAPVVRLCQCRSATVPPPPRSANVTTVQRDQTYSATGCLCIARTWSTSPWQFRLAPASR